MFPYHPSIWKIHRLKIQIQHTPPQQQTIERNTREVIIHEVHQLLEQQFIPHITRTVQTTLQTAQQQCSEPQQQSQHTYITINR